MRKIIFYGILIFIFSVGIGYYYSSLWKQNNLSTFEEIKSDNTIKETIAIEEKIGFDTDLLIKKYYGECGHVKVIPVELPIEFVNLTLKELEEMYKDWNIETFNDNEVVISQNIDTMCDEHYVIKMGNKNVEIYRMKEFDDFELVQSTNISKEYLTEKDIETLEEGIFVFGMKDLNAVLEDFE